MFPSEILWFVRCICFFLGGLTWFDGTECLRSQAGKEEEEEEEEKQEEEEQPPIRSNNPHVAGGEYLCIRWSCVEGHSVDMMYSLVI